MFYNFIKTSIFDLILISLVLNYKNYLIYIYLDNKY